MILTADWHLTDNPDDEYRWGLFPWLKAKIREKYGERNYPGEPVHFPTSCSLIVLGDISEHKDRHSARFVNRMVKEMVGLYRETGVMIYILKANHDGLEQPFFEFLKHFSFIRYITEPGLVNIGLKRCMFLPYTKRPQHDWKNLNFSRAHFVFAHITVSGAKSETDFVLEGSEGAEFLKDLRLGRITGEARVFSGDVHVPQKVGAVHYVGAPYPVRFGDSFRGRVLWLGRRGSEDWHYPTIKKAKVQIRSVSDLDRAWLRRNDQVKVEIVLPKEERHDWQKHREEVAQWCEQKGVVLRGVELRAESKLRLGQRDGLQMGQRSMSTALSSERALNRYIRRTEVDDAAAEKGKDIYRKTK